MLVKVKRQTYKQHLDTKESGFHRKKKQPVNKMEHGQDEQSDGESDYEDAVHVLADDGTGSHLKAQTKQCGCRWTQAHVSP